MSWTSENDQEIQKALAAWRVNKIPQQEVRLVSAYYSGVGTEFAWWRKAPWRLKHLYRAMLWQRQALKHARSAFTAFLPGLVDPEGSEHRVPTADHVDVLATVFWRLGRSKDGEKAISLLKFIHEYGDKTMGKHTQAFIMMHRVRFGLDSWSNEVHDCVLRLAQQIANRARQAPAETRRAGMGQAARIMRQLALFLPKHHTLYAEHLAYAELFAKEGGATDQLLKLGKR